MTDQLNVPEGGHGRPKPRRPKQYMRATEREQFILEEAVRFFAEHGFEGQTRELAKRIGITHSAIYRHFPSKEALIERVYEHVYLSRWDEAWAGLITDRSRPLEGRLTEFYLQYVNRVFHYDWVRIFVFSGLKAFDITPRYLDIVRQQIIEPACLELRHELGLPGADETPLTERETELFWGLHGRIFYLAIRRFVYSTPTPVSLDDIVRDGVKSFMLGGPEVAKAIVQAKA
ncbi:AcrR family transcriptional regulator [Rhizobium petrolearium]|nr:AcrR family transcriptional regulator [Neorhizobium petrolearium]